MIMTQEMQPETSACKQRLLEVLRRDGPQTLDALCELPEFNWAEVLMAVDHLSRSRDISLELIGPRQYQVSLAVRK
jgi:hypothetical protein